MEITSIGDMATFVAAVKAGSFAGAAGHLGLTRSAVSKSVGRLEEQLNTRLLHRTTRSLSLTDDGAVLYERCLSILDDLEDIESTLAKRRNAPRGRLKLSLPIALGQRYILPLVERYMAEWPEVTIVASFTDRFVDLIEDGFDLAIRIGEPKEDSRLLSRTVALQRLVTCASPAYIERYGEPVAPGDLANHECMHFIGPGNRPFPWVFECAGSKVVFDSLGRLQMDHGEAIHHAALAGLGIARLPLYLVGDDIRSGALVSVLDAYAEAPLPIRVTYPSKSYLSPKTRQFIDALVESWTPLPPWEVGLD
jgi:DNA-binding transcriptional LysR family regulator